MKNNNGKKNDNRLPFPESPSCARSLSRALALATLMLPSVMTQAQDFDAVQISVTPLRDGIYMLQGSGGNIGLSIGDDGAFIIDDQFAPLTDKIVTAIGELTDQPVEFVVNTHFHYDHTDGNPGGHQDTPGHADHRDHADDGHQDRFQDTHGDHMDVHEDTHGDWPHVDILSHDDHLDHIDT